MNYTFKKLPLILYVILITTFVCSIACGANATEIDAGGVITSNLSDDSLELFDSDSYFGKEVLYITSYRSESDRFVEIEVGLEEAFDEMNMRVPHAQYIYLDFDDERLNYDQAKILHDKYAGRDLGAVIIVNHEIYNFIKKYCNDTFSNVPIICLLSEYDDAVLDVDDVGPNNIHIIFRSPVNETIDFIKKTCPNVDTLYLTGDGTKETAYLFDLATNLAEDKGMSVVSLANYTVSETIDVISNLPENAAVYGLCYRVDPITGEKYRDNEILSLFANKCSVPFYLHLGSIDDASYSQIYSSLMGGVVSNLANSGKLAGMVAINLTNANNLDEHVGQYVYRVDDLRTVLNYPGFNKFNIDPQALGFGNMYETDSVANASDVNVIHYINVPNESSIKLWNWVFNIVFLAALFGVFAAVMLVINNNQHFAVNILKKISRRLNIATDSKKIGLYVFDLTLKREYKNKGIYGMFLHDETFELYPDKRDYFRKLIHPDQKEEITKIFDRGRKEGGRVQVEVLLLNKDMTYRWRLMTVYNIVDKNNNQLIGAVVFEDIDKGKRETLMIASANQRLETLASISRHDIKNTLLAFNGYLEYIQIMYPNGAMIPEKYAKPIARAILNIQQQVNFSSDYHRVGMNELSWMCISDSVDEVIDEFKDEYKFILNRKHYEILSDMLFNVIPKKLIENTKRYAQTADTISFYSSEFGDGTLHLIYEDNGVGVADDRKSVIFEKGYGGDSGYSLFLITKILALSGMTICENGINGKGARFEITVPSGYWRRLESQDSRLKTQDSRLKTQDSRLKTQEIREITGPMSQIDTPNKPRFKRLHNLILMIFDRNL